MAVAGSLIGFADFTIPVPLEQLAERLSVELFGNIRFTNRGGGWDEVPCLLLERDFLGLRIVLGGNENTGYTLELETTLDALVPPEGSGESVSTCDVSLMLKQQLVRIPGLSLSGPKR